MKNNTRARKRSPSFSLDRVQALSIILGLLTISTVFFCLLFSWNILRNPFPTDYVNGVMMNYINLFMTHGTYFLPIDQLPAVHGAYPPVFITIAAALCKMFGSSFLIIRSLSFTFSIVLAILVFVIIRQLTNNKLLALFMSGLFFAPQFMYDWITAGRVDMLAILFSVLGIFLYVRNDKNTFWPIVCFVLAFFTKQVAILGAAAVFIDMLFIKQNARRALIFAFSYGAAVLLIFGVINTLTHGQFYLHMVTYTKIAGIEWQVALTKYMRFIRPLSVLGGFVLYGLLSRKLDIFGVYCFLNILFLATSGKDGAATNYFIEPFVSMLLFGSLAINDMLQKYKKETALILVLLLFQVISLLNNPRYYLDILTNTLRPDYTTQQKLYDMIKDTRGEVLCEDVGYLTMTGKQVWLGEPFQFMKMAQAGMWDPSLLLKQRYQLICAGERIKNIPGMNDLLNRYYRKVDTVFDMDIYR